MIPRFERRELPIGELRGAARRALDRPGWRFGHQTAREMEDGRLALELLLLDTREGRGEILTAGGRVLAVTALGDDREAARRKAYEAIARIRFEGMHYRRDIAAPGR